VQARFLAVVVAVVIARPFVSAAPLPVVMREGAAYVAAAPLEREAGIVIKQLPGRGGFVACGAEQCAPLKSSLMEGQNVLVPVAALAEAMNLTANFDEQRAHVTLAPGARANARPAGQARVGSLVPNLRLAKLDGAAVTLDELRGQRVLINSWASW
jgi:hypothetical protein